MLLREFVVPGGVVRDEIEDHLEALCMCGIDEGAKVLLGTEFGVHRVIVLHGIGAAKGALAVFRADRVDRHEPENIDAQFLEARQFLHGSGEGSFGCELAGINLIKHRVARPFGMRQCHLVLGFPTGRRGSVGARVYTACENG